VIGRGMLNSSDYEGGKRSIVERVLENLAELSVDIKNLQINID
jgi:hypothetical protein